ncbi:hypothetical protein GCM10010401_09510 [Rarobacter faecitabidus]|uniref:Uncharacterized protein n=1 Tax=Rarobacter faecitabidus TaxID=13243 RepID=A0A542ZA55_RARFA|nr:hypothetical protein [Rarobacter faecitabidus]TQL57224.1 hypothetical protein FB461_2345 [Rarobacter faecitabidus]
MLRKATVGLIGLVLVLGGLLAAGPATAATSHSADAAPVSAAQKITKKQAKTAFKKFAKAAKSGSLKKTLKLAATKKAAKKAVKYFGYVTKGDIVSEKKTVNCYQESKRIVCSYYTEQTIADVSFPIIQQVTAVAKRSKGKIVFTKLSYANNLG